MMSEATPRGLGFRWPAEWEPHRATWLAWPHNRATWPGAYEAIPSRFAAFVATVAQFEPVKLLASLGEVADAARSALKRAGGMHNIELVDIETDDAWIRDYGPTFLLRELENARAAVQWKFNAWGGKYPDFAKDNAASDRICTACRPRLRHCFDGPLTLEGGAIEGNGQGDVLTTASCLLSRSRNHELTPRSAESILGDWIGAERVHWLPNSQLCGDDTDGHIDQLARFTNANTVVVTVGATDDPSSKPLEANCRFLREEAKGKHGRGFDVVPLPMPSPKHCQGQRLPASYCNFYILNGAVIIPAFDDPPSDERAAGVLRELFPTRRVISLPALDLVWGLGAFHCLTQPQW